MATVPFTNKTTAGNERAIRRGKKVPEDAVNLAWVQSPKLTPENNVVIVDTSRIVAENSFSLGDSRALYVADSLGILEHLETGDQLIGEEFPFVTDVFSVDPDFVAYPASQYRPQDALPFLHVSRFFHLDFVGLTLPQDLFEFDEKVIKVVDGQGRVYLDGDGKPRYQIRIAPTRVHSTLSSSDQAAYRVYAYVDTDQFEELYLVYNKVELTLQNTYKNQLINYRELLNVRPVFEYVPEESEVVDRASYNRKIYSTKPITLKQQVLGLPYPNVDGYRVYVPKKAIGDPRIFQLFHWRLACDFTQAYQVDVARSQTLRCGVIVTNANPDSAAPYALLNLSRSAYNATGIQFENPIYRATTQQASNRVVKETAAYWYVNFDTVTFDQLKMFDFLIWAPTTPSLDLDRYASKIDFFVRTSGGTIFFDTCGFTRTTGLGLEVSAGISPSNGAPVTDGTILGAASAAIVTVLNTDVLMDGVNQLGGWDLLDGQNNDEIRSLSWVEQLFNPGYTQWVGSYASDWTPVVQAEGRAVTLRRIVGNGELIFSTFGHLYTCSALFSYTTPDLVSANRGAELFSTPDYQLYINSTTCEGGMKLLFNSALLAVKGRSLGDGDDRAYSTSWTYYTDWKSSWVINADDDALSQDEKDRNSFSLLPETVASPSPVWKRKLAPRTCDELMNEVLFADPVLTRRQQGAVRRYRIEVTNKQTVLTDQTPAGTSPPYAWTKAYTPKFLVPVELGPHIIRAEELKGQYGTGQYAYRTYPPKPYRGFVRASYAVTSEQLTTKTVTWTAVGTADETVQITRDVPPVYSQASDVTLNWWNYPQTGSRQFFTVGSALYPRFGYQHPTGIATFQEQNYYAAAREGLNWPYAGFTGLFESGSSGEVVQFVQEALNKFRDAGFFSTGAGVLAVDGRFGGKTAQAVRDLQTTLHARFVDGIIDAETWSIIGFQILRGGFNSGGRTDFYRFFDYPYGHLPLQNISDGDRANHFSKRSWFANGPAVIWDLLQITFDREYDIHAVTVVPYLEGQTQTMLVRSIKVSDAFPLTGYNESDAQLSNLPFRPQNGEEFRIPFGPYRGDTITIGVGQDGPAGPGWGSARMFGVRDIYAHTTLPPQLVVPGRTETTFQTNPITITATGTINVTAFRDEVRYAVPTYSGSGQLSNIQWHSVSVDATDVTTTLAPDGQIRFRSQLVTTQSSTSFVDGPRFPGADTYYSTDENGVFNPVREVGQVSVADGIKLLCKADKSPYGFPTIPTGIGPNETQRHFARLTLSTQGTDANVMLGFYDRQRREFITDNGKKNGSPVMSYIEWMSRGQQNVYIAAISSYEAPVVMRQIPEDDDAPKLPYRWAMPIYGLSRRPGARITLEPLPKNLGTTDIWPVAVRDGRFNRELLIRTRTEGFLTTYLKDYQGSKVRAFYGIPESAGWSTVHGPPFADVIGEEPEIIDDDVIRVRQAPIHLVAEPTVFPGLADPVRPVFTFYKRTAVGQPWVAQPWSEIRDYNISTGEIFLTTPLQIEDTSLLKVDYTTERRHFYFKRSGSTLLNLNPYQTTSSDLIGRANYIYLLPQYVKDPDGGVILASVTLDPLRFATSPEIFDPLRPEYDPLAILLGVVYVSAALDIADLTLLDTRVRGGGGRDGTATDELVRLVQEASTYWDVGYGAGSSYQKAGFVVVRLPAALKSDFTETEIVEAIERNLTVGVRYKIEDLAGNDWS